MFHCISHVTISLFFNPTLMVTVSCLLLNAIEKKMERYSETGTGRQRFWIPSHIELCVTELSAPSDTLPCYSSPISTVPSVATITSSPSSTPLTIIPSPAHFTTTPPSIPAPSRIPSTLLSVHYTTSPSSTNLLTTASCCSSSSNTPSSCTSFHYWCSSMFSCTINYSFCCS